MSHSLHFRYFLPQYLTAFRWMGYLFPSNLYWNCNKGIWHLQSSFHRESTATADHHSLHGTSAWHTATTQWPWHAWNEFAVHLLFNFVTGYLCEDWSILLWFSWKKKPVPFTAVWMFRSSLTIAQSKVKTLAVHHERNVRFHVKLVLTDHKI